jgi:hypothetical protein
VFHDDEWKGVCWSCLLYAAIFRMLYVYYVLRQGTSRECFNKSEREAKTNEIMHLRERGTCFAGMMFRVIDYRRITVEGRRICQSCTVSEVLLQQNSKIQDDRDEIEDPSKNARQPTEIRQEFGMGVDTGTHIYRWIHLSSFKVLSSECVHSVPCVQQLRVHRA